MRFGAAPGASVGLVQVTTPALWPHVQPLADPQAPAPEAHTKAAQFVRPKLVIANVANPRGGSVLIRSLQAMYAAPVLALSARFQHGLEASKDAARRLGVSRVLPKPFTRTELLKAVEAAIKDAP